MCACIAQRRVRQRERERKHLLTLARPRQQIKWCGLSETNVDTHFILVIGCDRRRPSARAHSCALCLFAPGDLSRAFVCLSYVPFTLLSTHTRARSPHCVLPPQRSMVCSAALPRRSYYTIYYHYPLGAHICTRI